MRYLLNTIESYRVDTEAEAEDLIAAAKNDKNYELTKYTSEHKEAKSKGEIIDEWYKVTLVKYFTAEKEPDRTMKVKYEVDY